MHIYIMSRALYLISQKYHFCLTLLKRKLFLKLDDANSSLNPNFKSTMKAHLAILFNFSSVSLIE